MFRKMSKEELQSLASAGINFLSLLAASNLVRMGVPASQINYTKAEEEKKKKKWNEPLKGFPGNEEIDESKMGDLLIDIQQGATAKELAKYHNISIQTAKNFLSDYYGNKKSRTAPGLKKEEVKEGTSILQKDIKGSNKITDIEIRFNDEKEWKRMADIINKELRKPGYKGLPKPYFSPDPLQIGFGHAWDKKAEKLGIDIKPIVDLIVKQTKDPQTRLKSMSESKSREDKLKEQKEHAKQSPFKLKSQQYPRAVAINTDGFGKRHATVEDIITACDSFGMIIDKELQVEQIQKQLGKKGFISYKTSELEDVFEERETERMILALESDVEKQTPIEYTQGEIAYAELHEQEIEFLKPDGTKSAGPILKMSGKTYNVKDKFTGKSFTYKYSNKLEENKVDYEKSWTQPGDGFLSFKELSEAKFSPALIKKAIAIANKKEFKQGNYSGAAKAIEKLKKGLSDDPTVKDALRVANEDINEVSLHPDDIRKTFPNVWAQKDDRMNSILMALVNLHGYNDNVKAYKKNPKSFIDSLKRIGKNDASLKKAGLTKKNIGEGFDIDTIDEWVSKDGTRRRVKERDQRKYKKVQEWEEAAEASGDKEAYQKFFNAALKKFGVSSPDELEGDKKKEFFNYIDKNWKADHEEVDVHKNYKVDGRRKNFREKMRKLGYVKGQ